MFRKSCIRSKLEQQCCNRSLELHEQIVHDDRKMVQELHNRRMVQELLRNRKLLLELYSMLVLELELGSMLELVHSMMERRRNGWLS